MSYINPSAQQLNHFRQENTNNKPIVMLNLLKFKDYADYGDGKLVTVSGVTAYNLYSQSAVPLVWEVGGQILWRGHVRTHLIGPIDEEWHEAALVYYPHRQAFLRMVESDAYQKIMLHRTAALADSRLIETEFKRLPTWLLNVAKGAVRAKSKLWPQL